MMGRSNAMSHACGIHSGLPRYQYRLAEEKNSKLAEPRQDT